MLVIRQQLFAKTTPSQIVCHVQTASVYFFRSVFENEPLSYTHLILSHDYHCTKT